MTGVLDIEIFKEEADMLYIYACVLNMDRYPQTSTRRCRVRQRITCVLDIEILKGALGGVE